MEIKKGFHMKQVGDRYFLFSENSEDGMFVLNDTTKGIIEGIQLGKSTDEILEGLKTDYNEKDTIIEEDFYDVINQMREAGILTE